MVTDAWGETVVRPAARAARHCRRSDDEITALVYAAARPAAADLDGLAFSTWVARANLLGAT